MRKRCIILFCLSLLFCLALSGALAEQAKVVTPGGAANVRKSASRKADLIWTVPNGSMVDADPAEEGWARITYNGKQGFIMEEYLRRVSDAVGKTLYPEDDLLPVLVEPAADSVTAGVLQPF